MATPVEVSHSRRSNRRWRAMGLAAVQAVALAFVSGGVAAQEFVRGAKPTATCPATVQPRTDTQQTVNSQAGLVGHADVRQLADPGKSAISAATSRSPTSPIGTLPSPANWLTAVGPPAPSGGPAKGYPAPPSEAQATPPTLTPRSQEQFIAGLVLDGEADTPIVGAELIVRATPLRAFTDAEGRFTIGPLEVGSYTLVIAAAGFATSERQVEVSNTAGTLTLQISLDRLVFDIPGITVTAGRAVARPGEAPASVAVVGGDEIRNRNVIGLEQALDFAQGVNFNAGEIDIRGASGIARGVGSRVLMLLDGHRVLSGVGSSIDFGGLPLLDVDRIEVVKGPNSTLWGANALGGVVNVITRRPPGPARTVVRGYFGLFDTPGEVAFTDESLSMQGLQLQHTRLIGGADATLFLSREASDGFRQNGGMERWRLRAKSVFAAESANPWELFINWKQEDAEEFFTWQSEERRLEVDPEDLGDWVRETHLVAGLTTTPFVSSAAKLQLRPQLYHAHVRNNFHDNQDFHRSTRYATDLQLSFFPGDTHSLATGMEVAFTQVASNFLSPDPTVTEAALYAQDEIVLSDDLRASAGVRVDIQDASVAVREMDVNPRLGVVYRPSERLSLRSSVSRGYRAPSVSERFTATTVFGFRVVPNPELRGETAWSGEAGATASVGDWLWVDAGLFWTEYDDLIEVAVAPEQIFTFQFRNVTEARVRGLDTGLRVGLVPERLRLRANYLFLDSQDKRTGGALPYRSRHNLTTTLSSWQEMVAVDLRRRSRVEEVLVFPLDDRENITLVDLRLATRIKGMDVQAKVENLLQARYVDVQERNPGSTRSFRLTVTSTF